MLKSYLKVALRTLGKQKVVSAVTIGSLAVGLACCLLLFLYVRHEWTYDRFHADADRIFRVVTATEGPDGTTRRPASPVPMAEAMTSTFPEVAQTVRLSGNGVTVRAGEHELEDQSAVFADSTFFDVFTFPLARGTAQSALAQPGNVVLSPGAARRYFSTENPIGQHLTVAFDDEPRDYRVAGVTDPLPANSSIQFDLLLSFENKKYTLSKFFRKAAFTWKASLAVTYLQLPPGASGASLEAKLPGFVKQHYGDEAGSTTLQLQPLPAVHLDPGVQGGMGPVSDPLYSYILGGIALLVLLLAGINFTVLSLARAARRAPEVGIRKTVGALREQVAAQFWGEAVLVSACALLLGIALARLALPVFNALADVTLQLDLGDPWLWAALVGLIVLSGALAGAYPAVVLSGFSPVAALRGHSRPGSGPALTHALVVVQFALATGLVAGVFVMQEQFDYLSEKNIGFDEERVVVVSAGGNTIEGGELYDPFRREVMQHSGVEGVTSSFSSLGSGSYLSTGLQVSDTAQVKAYVEPVDSTFLDVMDVTLLRGRGLGGASGARDVLVNEALVRSLGWRNPLGKQLPVVEGATFSEAFQGMTVAGVVEDFHFESMRSKIAPLVVAPRAVMGGGVGRVLVRLAPGQTQGALAHMKTAWQRVAPEDKAFEYTFLEETVRQQYENERRWQALVRYAAGLALLISCAGLFGLALLTVQRREKEIGIRKVMGASAWNVTALVAKQFALLVAAGFALAVPLAWLGARRWLETFAYRIELGARPFLVAGLAVLAVAMATVGYQALRAARANPVEALRQE